MSFNVLISFRAGCETGYYCKHNITSINYGVCLGTPTALTAVDTVGECTILIGQ